MNLTAIFQLALSSKEGLHKVIAMLRELDEKAVDTLNTAQLSQIRDLCPFFYAEITAKLAVHNAQPEKVSAANGG